MFGLVAGMFSVLLIATGISKLRRPQDTVRALAATGVPGPRPVTYLVAVLEVGVGCTALILPSAVTLGSQAVLYGLFLCWVVLALRLDAPLASCGCLGRGDTPPYWGHVVVNIMAVAASMAAASAGSRTWTVGGPLVLAADLVLVAAGAWIAWHVIGAAASAGARRAT